MQNMANPTYAQNDHPAYANACRSSSSSTPSRSQSPKFNIADFENNIQFPHAAHAAVATRETSYASQAAIDDLDFARSSGSNTPVGNRYSRNINTSFLKRSASKLLPRAITTANLPTPPASQPNSGASSPTKSISSFISAATTNRSSSTISSSASRASVRAKTASKVLFDNYFNGDSNNVLSPYHSRSNSFASSAPSRDLDGYEPDFEASMATTGYTRPPVRTRPRRSPTVESTSSTTTNTTTYAAKLGSWFSKQSSPKATSPTHPSSLEADDPLLNLDMQSALFPYGHVDPLNPASFNDLLSAAEALISTYQNAYRQRVAELSHLRAEVAVKDEEMEECETRAQCLKAQLRDMGEQCTAQTQRADSLEQVLRERPASPPASCTFESRETLVEEEQSVSVGQTAASDSGFESDGDSVLSRSPIKDRAAPAVSIPSNTGLSSMSRPHFSNDLRLENEMLRQRVVELEGAVDSCLDMISNPLAL